MANKVYNFSKNQISDSSIQNPDVYIDLNMSSKNNNIQLLGYDENEWITKLLYEKNYERLIDGINNKEKAYVTTENKLINQLITLIYNAKKRHHQLKILEDWLKKYKYQLDILRNEYAVYNSLKNIFSWIQGERIILPEFGSKLKLYLYEGITEYNREQIITEIRGIISRWEPRVEIENIKDITTTEDKEDNTVRIDIIFKIIGLDKTYNYTLLHTKND